MNHFAQVKHDILVWRVKTKAHVMEVPKVLHAMPGVGLWPILGETPVAPWRCLIHCRLKCPTWQTETAGRARDPCTSPK